MEILGEKRKQFILGILEQNDEIFVQDVAQRFKVSPMTVRRDLTELEGKGLLVRTHGGAIKTEIKSIQQIFENKIGINQDRKESICKIAASHIQEKDIIFIDCGTTLFHLSKYIRNIKNLKVITNSLPVVSELINYNNIKTILIGGEIDNARKAIYGSMAEKVIEDYHANKAFIGADGVSIKNGLSSYDERESAITKRMAFSSDEVFLLCDSSKIEKDSYVKFAPISLINFLVTDGEIPQEIIESYKENNIEIINH